MIEQWTGRLSIKTKMILGFLSVTLLSLLLMSAISNYYYSQAVENEFYTISDEATARLNHHLDFYFRQIAKSTASLLESDLIQDWLDNRHPFTSQDVQSLEGELRGYVALNYPEIVGMYLVSSTNRVLSMDDTFQSQVDYATEPWFNQPLSPKLTVTASYRTRNPQAGGNPVFSLIVPVYSVWTLEQVGRLVIEMTLAEIDQTLGMSALGKTGIFFIVAPDGTIVYHPETAWIGLPLSQTKLAPIREEGLAGAPIRTWNGKRMLLSSSTSTLSGWSTVAFVPFDEMATGLKAARSSTLLAFAIIVLIILLLVPILANSFVRPIRQLKELMYQVSRGRLEVRAQTVPGQDEVHQLGRSFNVMVERLRELIQTVQDLHVREIHLRLRQKEALIQALQNQINPHLLYNSLDIIKSIAYLENVPLIESMARNLADVYRYTAAISDKEVSLGEELRHLDSYLQIVKVRFPRHFQSRVYIHDKFHDCRIVKLTLQPIIENAVKYGIEPRKGQGAIMVSAYDEQQDLVIEIADNGPGMQPEEVERLNRQLMHISESIANEFVRQETLGLANVHARLVLSYGPAYGLKLDSFPERGTVVSIRIPLHNDPADPTQENR